MDQRQIEELILSSTQAESSRRQHAIELLDQLRGDPIRWSVGLMLFFDGSTPLSKFFGLSLIREYMSSNGGAPPVAERRQIREAIMSWLFTNSSNLTRVESYVINNVVTIVTLGIKHDFPEIWPSAFSDILAFGQRGIIELDITIRVLAELEVEVVMFNDARSKEEVLHNTVVKDAIRAGPIAGDIIRFLCQSAVSVRAIKASLSAKCLTSLSEMIGWVDNGLIVNDSTLPIIYQALSDPELTEAALTCLLELVKKGMDPYLKIQMVVSINLIPMLSTVKVSDPASRAEASSLQPPRKRRGISLVSSTDGDNENDTDGGTSEDDITRELAALLDVLLQELVGCWMKLEDFILQGAIVTSPADQQLLDSGPMICTLLNKTLPLVMQVFTLGDFVASELVVPSLNKFITMLKQQQSKSESIRKYIETTGCVGNYFIGSNYLTQFLTAIYRQMQYPHDFQFDSDGDDENAEQEAKKQIRKLFVNCCRVHPSECLQMVSAALSSLTQPLSRSAFPPLEAVLRLVHAFAECGAYFNELVSTSVFPQLIAAIHSTDVALHPHPQVLMAYFEICSRYARITSLTDIQTVVTHMVGASGLRHKDDQLRNRTAYLLLKLIESVAGPVCCSLIPIVSSFSDMILLSPGATSMTFTNRGYVPVSNGSLKRQSELYLLEAVGTMTSSFDWSSGSGGCSVASSTSGIGLSGAPDKNNGFSMVTGESPTAFMLASYAQQNSISSVSDPNIPQAQIQLLAVMLDVLIGQLRLVAEHPELTRFGGELADIVSHKFASIAALCSKGHSYKKHSGNQQYEQFHQSVSSIFESSLGAALLICTGPLVQHKPVRDRGVVYFHRMLSVVGAKLLGRVSDCYLYFIRYADTTDIENVIQLANSFLVEFGSSAAEFVDIVLGPALDRIVYLYSDEGTAVATATAASQAASSGAGSIDVPIVSLEATRVMLQKQYLSFLQHIASYSCHAVLTSSRNAARLDSIFNTVMQGLNGGGDGISIQGGIPLRRCALLFLSELTKEWVIPEEPSSLQTNGPVIDVSVINSPGSSPPPQHVSEALLTLLFQRVLPMALTICSGGTGLDMKGDVQSQGIIVDTGALICALAGRRPRETSEYFRRELLPGLGWHVNAMTPMLALLDTKIPVGTFKDSFKKLIRQNLSQQGSSK